VVLNERSKADDVTHAPGVALQQALGGVEHAVSHRSITKSYAAGTKQLNNTAFYTP
jgi:hypothetical protein